MIKRFITAIAASGVLLGTAPGKQFTDQVWEENQDIYQAILDHPFLTEMQDGSLSKEAFSFYLIQDAFIWENSPVL